MGINIRFFAAAFAALVAATASAGPASRTQRGLDFEAQGLKVKVEFYSDNIVRVYKEPAGKPYNKVSIPVIMQPEAVSLTYGGSGTTTTMATGKVTVSVNTETGGIAFADAKGNQMLRDKDYGTQFTPFNDAGTPSFSVRQAFLLDPDEVIYGLGQQQTGLVSQRNQKLLLRNQNMKICIPFVHSAKGYGLYWDNYSPTTFTDNPQEMSFDSEVGDLDQVLSRYAMRMLYTSSDIHTSLWKMLEIAGRACDVSRAYIFENSPDGRICRNTFEWCAEGVEPQISALQHCVYERMANYHRNFDENGIFCCRDIRDLPPENYRDLARQGIVSMLQCAIRDEGRMIGFIGFDECRVNRVWTDGQARALSLVASLLGNQLVKERLRERLALAERELSQLRSAAPRR